MRAKLGVALLGLALTLGPSVAHGGTSWYDGSDPGDNFSWDLNFDDTSIRIHDGECDGDGGYAKYYTTDDMGSQERIDDPDGCSSAEATHSGLSYLYRHITCEDHQFSPDPCSSNWNYE